jgi:hypothetical protein
MSLPPFQISLERPDGVYYAGEVVRGTVKLVTTANISTRSVRVRYRGEARIDGYRYEGGGTKILEERRYTIFGNYFNTAVLDSAGVDAYFSPACGFGVMSIPFDCTVSLCMVLRVMDIRAELSLLGEVVVNVSALIAGGTVVIFPLTRNGKPEQGVVTLCAKAVPASAGNGWDGSVHSTMVCELTVISATGLRQATWGKNNVFVQAYRVDSITVDRSKALPEPDIAAVLPAGTLEFPFAFFIRPEAPGTAEVHAPGTAENRAGCPAYVRYTLFASIDRARHMNPSVKRAITVITSHSRPSPSLLFPIVYANPAPVLMSGCCCHPWGRQETAVVRAALSRQVFASGEPLRLSVALQNNSSSPLQVTVVLERWVMLRPYPEQPSFHQRFMTATTLYEESVDAQSHWTFDGVRQGVRVPPAYPSFFGDHVGSFAHLDPVTFTYTVGVSVKPRSGWAEPYYVMIPM